MKALSWSELSCYVWSKEQWKARYVDGITEEPNPAMKLGKVIHQWIEDERVNWIRPIKEDKLAKIGTIRKVLNKLADKRAPEREVFYRADLDDIPLLAYWDGYDKENKVLYEYKTIGESAGKWEYMCHYNEQLSFYALMYFLKTHSFFREIRLIEIDTIRGNVKVYKTVRSKRDIDLISAKIKQAVKEMKESGLYEKRLTSKERALLNQQTLKL